MRIELTLACNTYDRTAPLQDGSVVPEGLKLKYVPLAPHELFRRQARHAEFDVAEFSLSTHALLVGRGDDRMVGIPVFPSRMFRHSNIYVRRGGAVRTPSDLRGGRIGVMEFQQTAAVWVRGLLHHEYDVPVDDVEWYVGPYDEPGAYDPRISVQLPPRIRVHKTPVGKTLTGMLEEGAIDALIGARPPRAAGQQSGSVVPLIGNYQQIELEYFRRTKIFPIMHTLVIRRDIYERFAWIAESLFMAFVQAKSIALDRLARPGALYCSLPWLPIHLAQTREIMGDDPFAYGLERNRSVIETLIQYSCEQGLLEAEIPAADLFASETRGLSDGP